MTVHPVKSLLGDEDRAIFVRGVAGLINARSRENRSDTPDFILAEVMVTALEAFEATHEWRRQWHDVGGVTEPRMTLPERVMAGFVPKVKEAEGG
jgi:hypothetical protein